MTKRELLEVLAGLKETYLTESQVIKLCGKSVNYNGATIKKLLGELVDSGDVIITERHKYALTVRSGLVRGKFIGNHKGFGFVERVEDRDNDIFIPERKVNGAVHGDEVLVKIVTNKKAFFDRRKTSSGERNNEGEVVRILKRTITQIWTYRMQP